jgi:2-amino-4-hydroxy-6-hydroxymethyldihydropteridine diphosphokinase
MAYIGLGSNLCAPEQQVLTAFDEIDAIPGVTLTRRSSLYRTAPIGYDDQPDYVNAVAQVQTVLAPEELLEELLAIEQSHGRVREFANAPRTLDLDILIYGNLQQASRALTLPHPRAHLRAFVLYPLMEIAPACVIPGRGPAPRLLAGNAECREQSIVRIAEERTVRLALGWLASTAAQTAETTSSALPYQHHTSISPLPPLARSPT